MTVFTDRDSLALEVIGLTKRFGPTLAVQALDLRVPQGAFYGLVGPNGAGKTTALSMAVGLLRPDAGSVRVLGADLWRDALQAKTLLGVLPTDLSLPEQLTGQELLTYMGLLRGLSDHVVAERSAELLDVMDLRSAGGVMVADYSTGMRKKIGLALALLHAPRLLVLDEPFEAIDPLSARSIKGILRRFVTSGRTVLLSSHVMPLVEELCDHVAVIAHGQLLAHGSLDEVRGAESLEQRFMHLVGAEPLNEGGLAWLSA